MGYLGVNWGLGGGNGIGAPPLVVFGTEEQKQRLLVPLLRGEQRCCLGITEPSGGSDVAGIKTTARRTEKGWIVNGQKKVRSFAPEPPRDVNAENIRSGSRTDSWRIG